MLLVAFCPITCSIYDFYENCKFLDNSKAVSHCQKYRCLSIIKYKLSIKVLVYRLRNKVEF